jgi:hypothetical protein
MKKPFHPFKRDAEIYDSGYKQGYEDGLRKNLVYTTSLEECVCVAWDYLKGHYNLKSCPLREIGKVVRKIIARDKRNGIQRSK